MPSSERVTSPGVFTNEIDQSFLPTAVSEIGAALIGPTVKGPAGIPTLITSYAEFQAKFGDTFKSGSSYYQYLTSHTAKEYLRHGSNLTVVRILDGSYTAANSYVPTGSFDGTYWTGSAAVAASSAYTSGNSSFTLYTLSDGSLQNSCAPFNASGASTGGQESGSFSLKVNNVLVSGSSSNLRWEVSSVSPKKGTFTLLIRRGNDSHKRKQILETWNNVSLDPNQSNYVAKIIGDQKWTLRGSGTTDPYLQLSGSYPNKSKYIRVEVSKDTVDYLDENGNIRASGSHAEWLSDNASVAVAQLPGLNSGSFIDGTDGYAGFDALGNKTGTSDPVGGYGFYDNIADANSQGFNLDTDLQGETAYEDTINLLGNQDEYDINLVLMPGVIDAGSGGGSLITKAIDMCEDRGDCFVIADPTFYAGSISAATNEAEARDSSYGAMYYPWVQIPDADLGKSVWVPPSSVMGGIYAFNDKVAHPWYAPAGLNRGGLDSVIQPERKLTHSNRDTLYDSNVNPIATFPNQGVTVWGQKTLQKKTSALDRINVRRLLIKVKKFIASSAKFVVFEQNTAATRQRFLNIVNPYLEQVQANSGLNAFRVIMDESNNPPSTVDRNILYGQILLQPTRTAEFLILDFTVQPTGTAFE